MKRLALAGTLGLLLGGCGGGGAVRPAPQAAKPTLRAEPSVLALYEQTVHAYPASAVDPMGFAVTNTGLVLVPIGGGVFAAGWNGWLVEPQQREPVSAVSATENGVVLAQSGEREVTLTRWERHARVAELAKLPAGAFDLSSAQNGALWIAGRAADGKWLVFHGAPNAPPVKVATLDAPVLAFAPAGADAAVVGVGSRIVLARAGTSPVVLAEARDPVEGLAVEPDGNVLFSTVRGIYRLERGGKYRVLAIGIHGPLRVERGRIYVLRREKHHVLELTPPAVPTHT